MPLTKPRPGTPMPSLNPTPVTSTIRTSVSADIHTTYVRVRVRVKNLQQTLQDGASSLASRLTTETCKRRKLRSSFQRTQSYSPPTAPSTKSSEGSSSFHGLQQAAKSFIENLRSRTAIPLTQNTGVSDTSSASREPISRPPVLDIPPTRPAACRAPTVNTPSLPLINRRALRKAIHRAPDLRSLQRRPPHAGFMPRVLPTFGRGESENWSLDGSGGRDGGAEQWEWVGENERGYVQFFVQPELETVLEEVDRPGEGEEGDGWEEEVWEC